jgi:hypothetical protein
MSDRALALLAFAFLELLAGLVLRNEALATRSRAEANLRRELACERRERESRGLYALLAAPAALDARTRQRAAAGRQPGRPDLRRDL